MGWRSLWIAPGHALASDLKRTAARVAKRTGVAVFNARRLHDAGMERTVNGGDMPRYSVNSAPRRRGSGTRPKLAKEMKK